MLDLYNKNEKFEFYWTKNEKASTLMLILFLSKIVLFIILNHTPKSMTWVKHLLSKYSSTLGYVTNIVNYEYSYVCTF